MKRKGYFHPKTKKLARVLRARGVALHAEALARGLLEGLWYFSGTRRVPDGFLPQGCESELSDVVGWDGEPKELLEILCSGGFLDPVGGGFVVHGWSEHADHHVRRRLLRAGRCFADGAPPDTSRATRSERDRWELARRNGACCPTHGRASQSGVGQSEMGAQIDEMGAQIDEMGAHVEASPRVKWAPISQEWAPKSGKWAPKSRRQAYRENSYTYSLSPPQSPPLTPQPADIWSERIRAKRES